MYSAKSLERVAQKELLDRTRDLTLDYAEKMGTDAALAAATKQASSEMARKIGVMGYMGMRGSSGAATTDIEMNGLENANLGKSILVGMGYAGLALASPVEMALAGKLGKGLGKKVIATTSLQEGLEELSEGAIDALHLCSVPDIDVGRADHHTTFAINAIPFVR